MLTDREIRGLKPKASRYEVPDGKNGLVVRVTPKGEKVFGVWWRVPKRFGGPEQKGFITLGTVDAEPLASARERAARITDLAGIGKDPRVEIEAEADRAREARAAELAEKARRDMTLLGMVERHLEARRALLKPKTLADYLYVLEYLRPLDVAQLHLMDLRRGTVREALRAVMREHGPGAARKLQTQIRAATRWAAAEDIVEHDVLAGLRFMEAEPKVRDRVLSDEEILKLWRACDEHPPVIAASVRLQLVLALRHPSETTTMRWSDLKQSRIEVRRGGVARLEDVLVYEMPGERRKHGIPHALPVPPIAVRILDELRPMTGQRPLVLDGWSLGRDVHWWTKRLQPLVENVTRHDLRRTAASGMLRLGISASAADVVLGHVLKGSARNYMHGPRLVEAAAALWRWSDHLEELTSSGTKRGQVLGFAGKRTRRGGPES